MITFGMPYLLETPGIEDAARLCAELGLSFVELNMNFPACQAQRLDPQLLYHLRREYGIFFTLHLPEEFDPFTFAEPVRRAWMDVLRDALTLAQALDMPIVNMHLPKGVYITLPEEKVYLYQRYAAEYALAAESFALSASGCLRAAAFAWPLRIPAALRPMSGRLSARFCARRCSG